MSRLRTLLLLPLAAALVALAACKSGGSDDTGVVEVRDLLLTHVSADEATRRLREELGGGATVTPNPRNNSVIVTGTSEEVAAAEEALQQIDVPRR